MKRGNEDLYEELKMAVHYDELWKNIIEKLFPQFLSYFMPQLYADVDLAQGY